MCVCVCIWIAYRCTCELRTAIHPLPDQGCTIDFALSSPIVPSFFSIFHHSALLVSRSLACSPFSMEVWLSPDLVYAHWASTVLCAMARSRTRYMQAPPLLHI